MKSFKFFAGALLLSSAGMAGIVQADFNESLDLPFFDSLGPKLEQSLGVTDFGSPPQLTEANIIANPSNFSDSLLVSFDPTTNLLTLSGTNEDDYQIVTVTLSNLVFDTLGQVVTGITPIQLGGAVVPFGSDPTPDVSPFFTSNSFGVTYSAPNYLTSTNQIDLETDSDIFQITLGQSSAPEPGTLGLMTLGMIGLLSRLRRKKS